MSQTDPTKPPVVHVADAHEGAHGPDAVHVYETSGIAEGNRYVPKWLVVVFLGLLVFYVGYIFLHWNAQPGTAKFK